MVLREIRFSIGGALVLVSLLIILITALGNVPMLNPGLIFNLGLLGVAIGFIGFFLIATAIFEE
jgi:hypothetical protein